MNSLDFIDTHCHLDNIFEKLTPVDFNAFRSEYLPSNFGGCVTISCDPFSIDVTLDLMKNPSVYGAFGMHPHEAQNYTNEIEAKLVQATLSPKSVAFGEIGLDYHYDSSPREVQREVFIRQINLAVKMEKPLIIHTREAEADTLEIMQMHIPKDWKIHVHCFTSSLAMAEKLLEFFPNLCLGFTGIVTFKNAQDLQAVAKITPLDRLLLETDGPYLAPAPHRGKTAHPGHIPYIAQKLAEIKSVSIEEIYGAARINTRKIYGI